MEPSIDPIPPLSPRTRWEAPQAPADVARDGSRRHENDPTARRRARERERERRRRLAAGAETRAAIDGEPQLPADGGPQPPADAAGGHHIDVRA